MDWVLVDVGSGDPEFNRVHGPYPTATAARQAAVAAGEGGRLDDTLWVLPLRPTFP